MEKEIPSPLPLVNLFHSLPSRLSQLALSLSLLLLLLYPLPAYYTLGMANLTSEAPPSTCISVFYPLCTRDTYSSVFGQVTTYSLHHNTSLCVCVNVHKPLQTWFTAPTCTCTPSTHHSLTHSLTNTRPAANKFPIRCP